MFKRETASASELEMILIMVGKIHGNMAAFCLCSERWPDAKLKLMD